ncbi:MAG: DUF3887 domain-containing protein [Actinomycetota bacterium]
MLAAFNDRNYQSFSKYFSERMENALPEEEFEESFPGLLYEKIGKYEPSSKQYLEAYEDDGLISVYYRAKFTKGDVLATVVFDNKGNQVAVDGLWFDSSKLRKQ